MSCECNENLPCRCLDRSVALGLIRTDRGVHLESCSSDETCVCHDVKRTKDLWKHAVESPATGRLRIVLLCTDRGVHWEMCPVLQCPENECLCLLYYYRLTTKGYCKGNCGCSLCEPTVLKMVNNGWGYHAKSCPYARYPPDDAGIVCECRRVETTSDLWFLAHRDKIDRPVCLRNFKKLAAYLNLDYTVSIHGRHFSHCVWFNDDAAERRVKCECDGIKTSIRRSKELYLTLTSLGVHFEGCSGTDCKCLVKYRAILDNRHYDG